MMFSGYYKESQKMAETFDEDGWLLTGNLGGLDADGFLKITARKKEITVLSNGKNVAPVLTLKLKRKIIISEFPDVLEKLYD